jgi:ribonuclease P protein component
VLAATQRLRRSSEFAAVMRGGRRAGRGAVVVHLAVPAPAKPVVDPQHDTSQTAEPARARSIVSPARAGFVVSKAVGNAVVRNKVRRRLRHLVSERLAGLPAGSMLVVRAQPAAAGTPTAGLAADLDAALDAARSPRRRRSPSAGAG